MINRKRLNVSSTSAAKRKVSRSRSRSRSPTPKRDASEKEKKTEKEFAWMDSDGESDASKKADQSAASALKPVSMSQVQSLGEMARHAPDLKLRLKRGDVRPRELMEVAGALSRSKFYDADIFELLHPELERACRKGRLGREEMHSALCDLAELNAYDKRFFEIACSALSRDVAWLPVAERNRLEAALKRVKHDPGQNFIESLRSTKAPGAPPQRVCQAFFRGQCRDGEKCTFSHDDRDFERACDKGTWRPANHARWEWEELSKFSKR